MRIAANSILFMPALIASGALCFDIDRARAQSILSPAPIGSAQSAPPATAPAAPAAPITPAIPASPLAPAAPAATPDGAAPAPAPVQAAKPKPKPKPAPLREMAISTDPTPTLQPETFFTTAKASERYSIIVDAGGWPVVPTALKPGSKGPAVAILRKRLAIEGDLDAARGTGETWDDALTTAVKLYQSRAGLRQTGIVAGATLKAINVPAEVRFRQLASSAQRLAGINFSFAERYVVVNIPSAAVEAVENGKIVRRYTAVVGDVDHRSPEVSTRIQAVNLNPTWTVPTSIIKNEIIPKMRKDPGYLARAKIRILDGKGTEIDAKSINWSTERAVNYTLRQDSGAHNSLGSIRINMPNKDAVYMHDTPSKRYFANDYRFLSHGCVRVEGVYDLAQWLLEGTTNAGQPWDKSAMQDKVKTTERTDIKLAKAVPVIWVYLTGYASADGVVHFRDDVYNLDTIGGQPVARAASR